MVNQRKGKGKRQRQESKKGKAVNGPAMHADRVHREGKEEREGRGGDGRDYAVK